MDRIAAGLCRSLPVSAGLCRSLQVSAGLCRSLQVSAGLCRSLQVAAGLCRSLQVSAGLCRSLQVSAGLCRSQWRPLSHLQRMSVSQVGPGLFLSGLDSALNLNVLSNRNITLIINASGLENVSYPQLEGLQVLHVPVQDQPHAPLTDFFEPVAESIDQNQTGATLVHCSAGRSRSPALVMAYLMRFKGLSLRRAHEVVLEQRPFIRPNAGFWRQLMDFERTLFDRNTVRMARTSGGVLPEALQDPEDSNTAAAYCVNV